MEYDNNLESLAAAVELSQPRPHAIDRTATCDVCSKPDPMTIRCGSRDISHSKDGHFMYPKALINSGTAGCLSYAVLCKALDHFMPKWRKRQRIVIDLSPHSTLSLRVLHTFGFETTREDYSDGTNSSIAPSNAGESDDNRNQSSSSEYGSSPYDVGDLGVFDEGATRNPDREDASSEDSSSSEGDGGDP
jgi:hypothetical protein